MNKNIFLILFAFFSMNAFAIDWVSLETPMGKTVFLDKDSILETDKYFFYNIKHEIKSENAFYIQTIQSSKFHPFSARLKYYKEDEYISLEGDYKNITKFQTNKLEPVAYGSIVNTCFNMVSQIQNEKNIKIEF